MTSHHIIQHHMTSHLIISHLITSHLITPHDITTHDMATHDTVGVLRCGQAAYLRWNHPLRAPSHDWCLRQLCTTKALRGNYCISHVIRSLLLFNTSKTLYMSILLHVFVDWLSLLLFYALWIFLRQFLCCYLPPSLHSLTTSSSLSPSLPPSLTSSLTISSSISLNHSLFFIF